MMEKPERTYTVSSVGLNVRIDLSVQMKDISASVWRDAFRLCYVSTGGIGKNISFLTLASNQDQLEKVLQGALFTRKD